MHACMYVNFDKQRYPVERWTHGIIFRGRWASHTGYHSAFYDGDDLTYIYDHAAMIYENSKAMPFLVGDDDCPDSGWHLIGRGWKRMGYEVRVPDWCRNGIRNHLLDLGCVFEDKINDRYRFPLGVSKSEIQYLLAPILAPGTRLTDQAELLRQLQDTRPQISLF